MNMNRGKSRTWQRLVLSLAGVSIIAAMWRWAVFHLYALPPEAMSAFLSITTNAFYVIGAIVIFMVTGRLIYEWKNSTAATVLQEGRNLLENREERRESHVTIEHLDETAPNSNLRASRADASDSDR